MNDFAEGNNGPMKEIAREKAVFAQDHTADGSIYFESNHCFIKGFGWHITDYLPEKEMGVVILTRNKEEIAQSYHRIGCSPLTSYGQKWLLTPMLRNPAIQPPQTGWLSAKSTYRFWNLVRHLILPFQFLYRQLSGSILDKPKCLMNYDLDALRWYVEETRAKTDIFMKRHPGIRYYTIDISELNDQEKIWQMLTHFDLEPSPGLKNIVGKRTNLKSESD